MHMDDDRLKQIQEFKKQLDKRKDELKNWRLSRQFYSLIAASEDFKDNYALNADYLDFEVVQAMACAKLEKVVNRMQEEYDNM